MRPTTTELEQPLAFVETAKPLISIVMPIYDRSYCVHHAVRSIIDQTFTNWELIVVDDGSNDADILVKRLQSFNDDRIKYRRIEHCGKIGKVRNYGNKIAQADIIVVHDSDDVAYPERLQEIYNAFQKGKPDVVYHGMHIRIPDELHETYGWLSKPAEDFDKNRVLREQYIPGQIAYKKEAVEWHSYDERISVCDDWQLIIEFALNKCKFKKIDKILYQYNQMYDSVNILGEEDGRREEDVKIIMQILKDDYGINSKAQMIKHTLTAQNKTGELIRNEVIEL